MLFRLALFGSAVGTAERVPRHAFTATGHNRLQWRHSNTGFPGVTVSNRVHIEVLNKSLYAFPPPDVAADSA